MVKINIDRTKLEKNFNEKLQLLIDKANNVNMNVLIYFGFRSNEEQSALYAQGRNDLITVNSLRKKANMQPITSQENLKKVTNAPAGKSKHNFGKAIDAVILLSNNKPDWNMTLKKEWNDWLNLARTLGFKLGADFSIKDYPHIEL